MRKLMPRLLLFAVLIAIFVYNHFFYDLQPAVAPERHTLDELEKKAIDTIFEMTKLLFSLATALFGLIGVFVFQHIKNEARLLKASQHKAVFAFVFEALSIDFGYVFMEKWVELLANGLFLPFDRLVTIPQTLQFSTFLVALYFAGDLALSEFSRRDHDKSKQ